MGEKKRKNEFNIRSSSDLVSGILAPVNVVSRTLFPKYTKNHEITIQSENPVDVLTEHSTEILNRLDPDRMIGKGMAFHTHPYGTIMTGKIHTSKSKVIGKVGGVIEFEDCNEYCGGIIEFNDSSDDEY